MIIRNVDELYTVIHVNKLHRILRALIISSFKRNQAVMMVKRAKKALNLVDLILAKKNNFGFQDF